jgi:hypothetical protein
MKKLISGLTLILFAAAVTAATLPPAPRGQKPRVDPPAPCVLKHGTRVGIPCRQPLPPIPRTGK